MKVAFAINGALAIAVSVATAKLVFGDVALWPVIGVAVVASLVSGLGAGNLGEGIINTIITGVTGMVVVSYHLSISFPALWSQLFLSAVIGICSGHLVLGTYNEFFPRSLNIRFRKKQILKAVASYIFRCNDLEDQRRKGELSDEWAYFIHGGIHCHYENLKTGEVVEAPIEERETPEDIDPYFFKKYVTSTNSFPEVARLIEVHDMEKILKVVSGGDLKMLSEIAINAMAEEDPTEYK